MVTWGAISTRTYAPSTPASSASSATAPSAFGFGSTPTKASTTSNNNNMFAGSTPGPAASNGSNLFGSSPFSLNNATSSASSTTTTTFISQNSGSPYHHAHVSAHLREEQSRIEAQLLQLANGYATTPTTSPAATNAFGSTPPAQQFNSQCRFQCLLYDPVSAPGDTQRPLHISVKDWAQAQAYNPNPAKLKPVSIVGAAALQSRVIVQHERATQFAKHVQQLQSALAALDTSVQRGRQTIESLALSQVQLEQRLLGFMYKLHLLKCITMGKHTISREERDWMNQMAHLKQRLRELDRFMSTTLLDQLTKVRQQKKFASTDRDASIANLTPEEQEQFFQVQQRMQMGLEELKKIVQRDIRDVDILMCEIGLTSKK